MVRPRAFGFNAETAASNFAQQWLDENDEQVAEQDAAEYASEREYDDGMDGDHESALASAGFGTDEDYGHYGNDE